MCRLLPQLTFLCLALLAQANINSTTKGLSYTVEGKIRKGDIRFHFDDSVQSGCRTVILMGVGTAMSVGHYDKLSKEIVGNSSIVFILTDFNPGDPFKNCHEKDFAQFALAVVQNLTNWIHVCRGTKPRFVVGGHSASGQSAMGALKHFYNNEQQFRPDGFIGLDPFSNFTIGNIKIRPCPFDFSHGYEKLPVTLNIDFERETCWVDPRTSAALVYNNSKKTSRVLIQIKNSESTSINHCSFTDHNCPDSRFLNLPGYFFCGGWNEKQSALVRTAVAKAIHVLAATTGSADPTAFKAVEVRGLEFHVAVNSDRVPVSVSYGVATSEL